ncbi:MAG: sn-glycerol-3-phosphate ABC transporter ATP-binding protein UgpC [Planctomycetes bacterium]|nr:sn-glycerol-3-phosphate ABC transporter ATP-binding protein UgpC [Planctomycetota bacterium]
MAEVNIKSVTKVYPGGVTAARNINLHIRDKELLVLVGPSGCGKSTTLRMVAGLEEITEGIIEIDGQVVNDVPPKDRDIAMVFQNYALYPHMTVYDNMAFGLKLRKLPKAEMAERVQEAARILGIADLLDRKPKQLSGGQRQRVAVGRAIVRKPKVFLFDEPLSNLDAKLRVEMRAELNKLHQRLQTTMIYVTHDQVEAMTLGDRIVVMDRGEVQQVAEPLELYDFPRNRFVASFIGTPPMNFLDGTLENHEETVWFVHAQARLKMPARFHPALADRAGTRVVLGIRPESLRDRGPGQESPPGSSLLAVINVIEPLGDQTLVYLGQGATDLIAKVDAHAHLRLGQKVEMGVQMEKTHVFDPETGRNLTLPGKDGAMEDGR